MITYWFSPSKINLFLYIIKKRNDGYHDLQTLLQLLNYGDTISIRLTKNNNILLKPLYGIYYKNNLVFKAINFLLKEAKKRKKNFNNTGVTINIFKRIPIGGGMGGGSSNAATVILALNKLWNINFNENILIKIGLMLGSDVPFFIRRHSAFAEGRGEKLKKVFIPKRWYLITFPNNFKISTTKMFQDPLLMYRAKKNYSKIIKLPFINDFEFIIKKKFKKIKNIIHLLSQYAPTRLTGTGSCVFSEFKNKKNAKKILKKIPKNFTSFLTKGINSISLYNK